MLLLQPMDSVRRTVAGGIRRGNGECRGACAALRDGRRGDAWHHHNIAPIAANDWNFLLRYCWVWFRDLCEPWVGIHSGTSSYILLCINSKSLVLLNSVITRDAVLTRLAS